MKRIRGVKMKYAREEAKVYRVNAYCDCGEALKYTGFSFSINPTMHEHECPVCNNRYNLNRIYPTIEVE